MIYDFVFVSVLFVSDASVASFVGEVEAVVAEKEVRALFLWSSCDSRGSAFLTSA